ncbi:hypothetical protein D3C80_1876630 [compost metagenome]
MQIASGIRLRRCLYRLHSFFLFLLRLFRNLFLALGQQRNREAWSCLNRNPAVIPEIHLCPGMGIGICNRIIVVGRTLHHQIIGQLALLSGSIAFDPAGRNIK